MRRVLLIFGAICFILTVACRRTMVRDNPTTAKAPTPSHATSPGVEARTAEDVDPDLSSAEQRIDTEYLRNAVAELSADELQGRGPGTDGDRKARERLIDRLLGLGYEPAAGHNQWEQPFSIVGVHADMPKRWTFRGSKGSLTCRWWDEFIAASGVQQPTVQVENAEIVFAGYGIVAPEQNWDDFGSFDVRGKILLLLNNDPDWDPELFEGKRRLYYGRWTYKYEEAARQGAAGAIIIHTTESAGYPWQVVQSSWSGEQMELPAGGEPRTPIHAWVTDEAAHKLVALGGHDLEDLREQARSRSFQPVPLGVKTSLRFSNSLRTTETANVAGLRLGSDPEVRDEVVVITAHHDHLGVGEPGQDGDRIYNGARDNASGMALALGVARGVASLDPQPRRSIMILFVGAEEQGLLGSKYFAFHPTVSAENLVANINFELGNIWGRTRDIVVVGKGKSTLEKVLAEEAARQDRVVRPPSDPDAGWYYRSDQLSFARIGVPALWYRSGTDFVDRPSGWGEARKSEWIAKHYHQPSDELRPDWNFEGMVEDARLGLRVVASVANANERPRWFPGDEFAAAGAE